MDEVRRALLDIRTVEVTYRAALRHAPHQGPHTLEWLGVARQRADQYLNQLESRLLTRGPLVPEIALRLRIARESIRAEDARIRGLVEGDTTATQQAG